MHVFLAQKWKKFYFEPLLKNTTSSFVYILLVEYFSLLKQVLQITLDDKIASFRVLIVMVWTIQIKTRLVYF